MKSWGFNIWENRSTNPLSSNLAHVQNLSDFASQPLHLFSCGLLKQPSETIQYNENTLMRYHYDCRRESYRSLSRSP